MCYHGNNSAINERKVGSIILIKAKNKKYHTVGTFLKSNIKHDSQQRKHNCNIELLKDKKIKCLLNIINHFVL